MPQNYCGSRTANCINRNCRLLFKTFATPNLSGGIYRGQTVCRDLNSIQAAIDQHTWNRTVNVKRYISFNNCLPVAFYLNGLLSQQYHVSFPYHYNSVVVCHFSCHHIISGILLNAAHCSIPTLAPIGCVIYLLAVTVIYCQEIK